MLQSAVERNFEIIGEALLRLERSDPDTAARITDYRNVIGFRNRLAHNYEDTDQRLVWSIISQSIPVLKSDTRLLLKEAENDSN